MRERQTLTVGHIERGEQLRHSLRQILPTRVVNLLD